MKKTERERRIHEKTAQQLVHRRYNKAHPVEFESRKKVQAAERLVRLQKSQGVAAMKAEKRRLRNLEYKTRRAARGNIFKKIAGWLKPQLTDEEKAKTRIREIMKSGSAVPNKFLRPQGAK
jgi:hypothetical protein